MQKHYKKKFDDKNILDIAKEILNTKKLCLNCLGRQFALVGTGLTNRERGQKLFSFLKEKEPKDCDICDNFFKKAGTFAKDVSEDLKKYEFKTFLIGTQLSELLLKKEEILWEEANCEYTESIKAEINREVGKLISKKTKKEMDRQNPDITIILDLENERTKIIPSPIFVYGGYKKLVRGLPQTKWEKYKETVEDIIAKPFMKATKAYEHSLHGMGREDIDARCLDWRPFVFELTAPKVRKLNLKLIEKEINKSKKVNVKGLRPSNKKEVAELKAAKPDKSYRVLVGFEKTVSEKDLKKVLKLKGSVIKQETPKRVVHRRADLIRDRKVKEISYSVKGKNIEFKIKGEAGLYIKELVTGDDRRTKPSIAETLKNTAKVIELDVIKIWCKL